MSGIREVPARVRLTKAQLEALRGMERWHHPVTGSRLSRILDHRFSDWAAPKLKALLEKGLVEIFEERAGQKYYKITGEGRTAILEKLADAHSKSPTPKE